MKVGDRVKIKGTDVQGVIIEQINKTPGFELFVVNTTRATRRTQLQTELEAL